MQRQHSTRHLPARLLVVSGCLLFLLFQLSEIRAQGIAESLSRFTSSRPHTQIAAWGGLPAPSLHTGLPASPAGAGTSFLQETSGEADSIIWIDTNVHVLADTFQGKASVVAAKVEISRAGHYRLQAKVWYNSGDAQQNESFFLQVISPDGEIQLPLDPNAGPYKVVADIPGPPRFLWRDAGVFYFARGTNTIEMHHYVQIARQYPQFVNGAFNTLESVYLDSLQLAFSASIDAGIAVSTKTARKTYFAPDSVGWVYPGETYQLELDIENGGDFSARNALVKLTLPAEVSPIQYSLAPSQVNGQVMQWDLPELPPGPHRQISLDLRTVSILPPGWTRLQHIAELITAQDDNPSNNRAQAVVYARADSSGRRPQFADLEVQLQLQNRDQYVELPGGLPKIPAGEKVAFGLRLHNAGPDTAKEVRLAYFLPAALSFQSFSLSPQTLSPDSAVWHFNTLPPDTVVNIQSAATVPECFKAADTLVTHRALAWATNDTSLANNFAADTIALALPRYDLSATLEAQTDTLIQINQQQVPGVRPGQSFLLQAKIRNAGAQPACGVEVDLTLPPGVNVVQVNPPQNQTGLHWTFATLAAHDSLELFIQVAAPDSLPFMPYPLTSAFRVQSAYDTLAANNADSVTVFAYEAPPPVLRTDVAIELQSVTDTTITRGDRAFSAIRLGESFQYLVRVKNLSMNPADSIGVLQQLPAAVRFLEASPAPEQVQGDSLIWTLPQLAAMQEKAFRIQVKLPEQVDTAVHELVSIASVLAANDSLSGNNVAADTVLVLRQMPTWPDLRLQQFVATDSFHVQGQDTTWFARPGETYRYTLDILNQGQATATGVSLVDRFPNQVSASAAEPPATISSGDSLHWDLGDLLPGQEITLSFRATLPAELAPGLHAWINDAEAWASNEPDSLRFNNAASDTVYSVISAPIPQPLIEALPPEVSVGDSVLVRLQVTTEIQSWDLWVYYANGEIDSTYGDVFLFTTRPLTGIWYEVQPIFRDTRLTTEAKEEQIIFEIRTVDKSGNRANARAAVRVKSANAFTLDRNVFEPESQGNIAIRFKLSSRRVARLDVYDLSGQHITKLTEGVYEPDWNTFYWNGLTERGQIVGSGVYIILLRSGEFQSWKKVIIVR